MENIRKTISWLLSEINFSVFRERNWKSFGISTGTAIVASWPLANFAIPDFWIKAISVLFTVICGPPLSAFMNDVYKEVIKPKIFKKKHRY